MSEFSKPFSGVPPTEDRCSRCGVCDRAPGNSLCEDCLRAEFSDLAAINRSKLLTTTNHNGQIPICACGGIVRPINCFNGDHHWRCEKCHHRTDDRPLVLATTSPVTADQMRAERLR